MASVPVRLVLFLSSYAPLFLILGVRYREANEYVTFVTLFIAAASAAVLFLYIHASQRMNAVTITTISVEPRSGEVMSYVVTYLIPFLDFDLTRDADVLALTVLLLVLAVIYVNSNMVTVNPLLSAARYHLFAVSTEGAPARTLVTRRSYVPAKGQLRVIQLGNYALMEKNA